MTTIATDGRLMAGDGRMTRGDVIADERRKKIFRLSDGSIVGAAGRTSDADKAVRALQANPKDPEEVRGDYSMLRLFPDGKLRAYEDSIHHRFVDVKPPYAIGSGWVGAISAMMAGANAREAVKIASKLDVHTGGKITSYSR